MTESQGSSQSGEVELAVSVPVAGSAAQAALPIDFRDVYQGNFDFVIRSLRRLGVPERDLEDLAHDVFVAFHRGQKGYDPSRPLKPWLFGIAFRVASDYRRRAANRYEVPDRSGRMPEPIDARETAEQSAARAEDRALVREALAALDLDRLAVLLMHDVEEYSMPEIASALSVGLNTLYSRLRLAREQFAAAVRRAQERRKKP